MIDINNIDQIIKDEKEILRRRRVKRKEIGTEKRKGKVAKL